MLRARKLVWVFRDVPETPWLELGFACCVKTQKSKEAAADGTMCMLQNVKILTLSSPVLGVFSSKRQRESRLPHDPKANNPRISPP